MIKQQIKPMCKTIFWVLLFIFTVFYGFKQVKSYIQEINNTAQMKQTQELVSFQPTIEEIDLTLLELTEENFFYVCKVLDIKHPEIVYAQAKLESGYFQSKMFKEKNNFLGLFNSHTHSYYSFIHWSECLSSYKSLVQYKWDEQIDYFQFLAELPYATDPNYIQKLQQLID